MVSLTQLDDLGRHQFGLITRAQVLAVMSRSQCHRLLEAGVLVRVERGVYRFSGTPPSYRQRAMAVCLAVGAEVAISHLPAAYLWQVPGVAAPPVEITVPASRRAGVATVRIHRVPLPAVDVAHRWGIPVTTPARTLIDLSATLPPVLLGRVADELLRRRHLAVGDIERRMAGDDALPRHRRELLGATIRGGPAGRFGA